MTGQDTAAEHLPIGHPLVDAIAERYSQWGDAQPPPDDLDIIAGWLDAIVCDDNTRYLDDYFERSRTQYIDDRVMDDWLDGSTDELTVLLEGHVLTRAFRDIHRAHTVGRAREAVDRLRNGDNEPDEWPDFRHYGV